MGDDDTRHNFSADQKVGKITVYKGGADIPDMSQLREFKPPRNRSNTSNEEDPPPPVVVRAEHSPKRASTLKSQKKPEETSSGNSSSSGTGSHRTGILKDIQKGKTLKKITSSVTRASTKLTGSTQTASTPNVMEKNSTVPTEKTSSGSHITQNPYVLNPEERSGDEKSLRISGRGDSIRGLKNFMKQQLKQVETENSRDSGQEHGPSAIDKLGSSFIAPPSSNPSNTQNNVSSSPVATITNLSASLNITSSTSTSPSNPAPSTTSNAGSSGGSISGGTNISVAKLNQMVDVFGPSVKPKATGTMTWSELFLYVAEGRALKDIGEAYCEIYIGHKFKLRTRMSSGKREEPFWGEDFHVSFQGSNTFPLVVTIWDGSKKSCVIGQTMIPVETLKKKEFHEEFYPVGSIRNKDFVMGDIHVFPKWSPSTSTLQVKVLEGRNLAYRNSNAISDPFLKLQFGDKTGKTKHVKKSLSPVWQSDFEFTISEPNPPDLILSVWDYDMLGSHFFMGQASVKISDLVPEKVHDLWLLLKPEEGSVPDPKQKVGDVRLRIRYTEEIILPTALYEPLIEYLTSPDPTVMSTLGRLVTTDREDFAKTLVNIFESKDCVIDILKSITGHEIDQAADPNTLFRANSLGSKTLDCYLKLVGLGYLKEVMEPIIKEIYAYDKPTEMDPTRLDPKADSSKNQANLLYLLEKTMISIIASAPRCPTPLRQIFHHLQSRVIAKHYEDPVVEFTVISGFLFLRFFCPAILGPKLFSIMEDHPNAQQARTLTLVSKTIQNLANLVEFGQKEAYMKPLNDFILGRVNAMKHFINKISTIPDEPLRKPPPAAIIFLPKELAHMQKLLKKNLPKLMEEPENPYVVRLAKILEVLDNPDEHKPSTQTHMIMTTETIAEEEEEEDVSIAIRTRRHRATIVDMFPDEIDRKVEQIHQSVSQSSNLNELASSYHSEGAREMEKEKEAEKQLEKDPQIDRGGETEKDTGKEKEREKETRREKEKDKKESEKQKEREQAEKEEENHSQTQESTETPTAQVGSKMTENHKVETILSELIELESHIPTSTTSTPSVAPPAAQLSLSSSLSSASSPALFGPGGGGAKKDEDYEQLKVRVEKLFHDKKALTLKLKHATEKHDQVSEEVREIQAFVQRQRVQINELKDAQNKSKTLLHELIHDSKPLLDKLRLLKPSESLQSNSNSSLNDNENSSSSSSSSQDGASIPSSPSTGEDSLEEALRVIREIRQWLLYIKKTKDTEEEKKRKAEEDHVNPSQENMENSRSSNSSVGSTGSNTTAVGGGSIGHGQVVVTWQKTESLLRKELKGRDKLYHTTLYLEDEGHIPCIIFVGEDNKIHSLEGGESGPSGERIWTHTNLCEETGALEPAETLAITSTKEELIIVYAGLHDNHIHQITHTRDGQWTHCNVSISLHTESLKKR